MTYKSFLFLILLLTSSSILSQTAQSFHKVYIPFWFGSGYGYEHSLNSNMTINASIDMRAYIGDDDFALDNFVVSPRISLEPRYYYNFKKRAENGKNTKFNAANYFSLDLSFELPYGFDGIRDWPQRTIRILPTYGIRRNIAPHLTIDFGVYAGYKLKEYGDRNPISGRWDTQPWTQHKFVYGLNILLNHMF